MASAVTAGNTLVCDAGAYGQTTDFTSITDSLSHTYLDSIPIFQTNGGTSQALGIQQYAANITGGTVNFTITGSTTILPTIVCKEISGVLTTGVLDQTNYEDTATGSTGLSSGNITTTQASEILLGGGVLSDCAGSSCTFAATAGWSEDENIPFTPGSEMGLISASRVVSSTGTYAFSYNGSESQAGALVWITTWKATTATATAARRRIINNP